MQAEYDGRQIVGIDLHRRRSVIVRMSEAGDQLGCVRIDNDPLVLAAEIAKAGEHPEVRERVPPARPAPARLRTRRTDAHQPVPLSPKPSPRRERGSRRGGWSVIGTRLPPPPS